MERKNLRSFPQGRNKKNAIPVLFFLTTYHKTMWTAKYNGKFFYEDDDDDIEICEQLNINCNY